MSSSKEARKKDVSKNSGFRQCFTAIVDRKRVNFDLDVLKVMIKKDLSIRLERLDPRLAEILPYILAGYIKNWPGWQKSKEFYCGKLTFKDWFEKFNQYIVLKINYVVQSGFKEALSEMESEIEENGPTKLSKEHNTQTDNLAIKGYSPYTISIECPPQMLNNIVFSNNVQDDILLRQHVEVTWTNISTKELLNWPYVHAEFTSPELSFTRKICHDYQKFISSTTDLLQHRQKKADFIEEVAIIDASAKRLCYTNNLLKVYVSQYIETMTTFSENLISKDRFEEACLMLQEFVSDIEEININSSIATNTSVIFNIGKFNYSRNKKIPPPVGIKGFISDVVYTEFITPRVELSFNFFKGIQDVSTSNVSFIYLNNLRKQVKNKKEILPGALPSIRYKCTFCSSNYMTKTEILEHFKCDHRMEQCVLCIYCKESQIIHNLAGCRWTHNCRIKKPVKSKSRTTS